MSLRSPKETWSPTWLRLLVLNFAFPGMWPGDLTII